MAAPSNTRKTYYDLLGSFELGMNSGVTPTLLPKNQLAFCINGTVRGGYVASRPPYQRQTLNYNGDTDLQSAIERGYFQGSGVYRPDFGPTQIVAQISGRLFSFTPIGDSWDVAEITISGDANSASATQAWMWQSEKWLIISDGSGALPIFYDGVSCRRSYGPSQTLVAAGGLSNPAPVKPPAIGSTVTMDVVPDFTGPFDVTVIFNGELYQTASSSGGGEPSYDIILTNVNDTPGTVVPTGTDILVDNSKATLIQTGGQDATNSGGSLFKRHITVVVYDTSKLTVGIQVNIPETSVGGVTGGPNAQWTVSSVNTSTKQVLLTSVISYAGTNPPTIIPDGATMNLSGSQPPNVVIGTTLAPFNAPAVGATVSITLNQQYSGPNGQYVWVNGKQYTISVVAGAGTPGKITLINLSDTSTADYDDGPTNPLSGKDIVTVPELPAGRMGAYGMGRNWMCLVDGISYIAGDIVGGPSGTQATNYRDSVLKMTENDYLSGGGSFRLPGSGNFITSMTFTANLDTSLGQGPLQIGTDSGMFSNQSPVDRATWTAVENPIQTQSLLAKGPLGQNSTILANSDVMFRSVEGIGSLIIARRNFGEWGNTPISFEVNRVLVDDDVTLLPVGSATVFDNRMLMTTAPQNSGFGVYHPGLVALNFDLISTLRGKSPPVYDGLWLGLNTLQAISGNFNGTGRSFVIGANTDDNIIELYELYTSIGGQHYDNGTERIIWQFETPVLFKEDVKPLSELVRLIDADISLQEIDGTVDITVEYRPDYYPCWKTWRSFQVCADLTQTNSHLGYRTRLSLGDPPNEDCETANNRQLRVGHFFQFRITITGHCKFMGMRVQATTQPASDFAAPVCQDVCENGDSSGCQPCQSIICTVDSDYSLYGLQGTTDVVPPASAQPYSNVEVKYSPCVSYLVAGTLEYDISTGLVDTPAWAQITQITNYASAKAGVFRGETQAEANATALTAITQYVDAQIASGGLVCADRPWSGP